jgi:hypothetical protein
MFGGRGVPVAQWEAAAHVGKCLSFMEADSSAKLSGRRKPGWRGLWALAVCRLPAPSGRPRPSRTRLRAAGSKFAQDGRFAQCCLHARLYLRKCVASYISRGQEGVVVAYSQLRTAPPQPPTAPPTPLWTCSHLQQR